MEKFVYICNESELIKIIEAIDINLQINDDGSFFHNNKVYAVQKDNKGKLYGYKDELFKNNNNISKITDFAMKIAKEIKPIITDIIYISIHPGGTSENEIKTVLHAVNTELNKKEEQNSKDKQTIFVTYHGSQNLKVNSFWEKEKVTQEDLNNLNKIVKSFINPDINQILKKYKSKVLIDKRLIDEAFGADFNCEKIKIIFEINDCNEHIINVLNEYNISLDNALNQVNTKYNKFYSEIRKLKENDT